MFLVFYISQVTSAKEQQGESLHGEALHKIAHLENKKQSGFGMEEEAVAAPPNFVVGLQVKFFSKVCYCFTE